MSEYVRPVPNERAAQVLTYIRTYSAKHGWSPSVREIGKAVGLNSTSSVVFQLHQLELQGWIKRGVQPRQIALLP